jgi:hypothetical protein
VLGTNHQGTLRINSKNNDDNTKERFIILKIEYLLHANFKSIPRNSTILDQFVKTDEILMLKVIEENQRNDFNFFF